jgi:site-specific DNA recombinase
MRKFFGYVRVSTAKQGEGVSLTAQREAISRLAERTQLEVAEWFEERETAAKRGRPVFNEMLKALRQGKAEGVIIHKIDRSARNLKDWADLGELIDQGVDVQFANESLDLNSRGGRLSADIQAVVAADYIRNLREEAKKGIYGRLKQGYYPMRAPIGYKDNGGGKAKTIDPVMGSLVRKAFELYASGRYNLESLGDELYRRGLRNRLGHRVSMNGLSKILNNPFYLGIIRIEKTGETFAGAHQPLVTKSLFDGVQGVLNGKTNAKPWCHDFLFRRLLTCKGCGYSLIGENSKGYTYYRCQSKTCRGTCIREEEIDRSVTEALAPLEFNEKEETDFAAEVSVCKADDAKTRQAQVEVLTLRLAQTKDRLKRLMDAYLDDGLEKELFDEKKQSLLLERKECEESLAAEQAGTKAPLSDYVSEFLGLAGSASLLYKMALPDEKRDLLKLVTSERGVSLKKIDLMRSPAFEEVAKRRKHSYGGPYRGTPRKIVRTLYRWFATNGEPSLDALLDFKRKHSVRTDRSKGV